MNTLAVSTKISPNDNMYSGGKEWYFSAGQSALDSIIEALGEKSSSVQSILDMPCGYGRVLRYLRAFWPNAEINACDLDTEAVDFCRDEFQAIPVYSHTDFSKIKMERKFDLIWCGSLLTHLRADAWRSFFSFMLPHISQGGAFAFTAHGRIAAYLVKQNNSVYGLPDKQCKKLFSEYRKKGFAYVNYDDRFPTYGVSLSSPTWVVKLLEEDSSIKIALFKEQAWGHQDMYVITRSWEEKLF